MAYTVTLRHDGANFIVKFAGFSPARALPKGAGFKFASAAAHWETTSAEVVGRMIATAERQADTYQLDITAEAAAAFEAARTALAEAAVRAQVSIAASAATDADIEIPAPEGLAYLPYQKAGIAYAMGKDGVLLADDMGLGKTIMANGICNADPAARRILIICPASLKLNWKREFEKLDVKGLSVGIAKGKELPKTDVVILNFEIVAKLRAEIDAIAWDVLIVDEAHYIKNPKAARTIAILGSKRDRKLPIVARRRVFMTGTPIVNRPIELWPLVESLDPDGLGKSYIDFAKRYCGAYSTSFGWDTSGATNLDELQVKLRSSIMVRRLKKDVLTELPAKRRQLIPIEANAEIKRIIRSMEQSEAETKAKIAHLRKLAKDAAPGSDAYKSISQSIRNTASVAFDEMSAHRHALAVAKAPLVVEHVREILDAEDSVVVAVYHLDVVDILVEGLRDLGVHLITGEERLEDRQAAKDDFQAGKGRVVIGTIGAMAEDWTLTRASTMVFGELDWTPGKVTQTEDRIHRLGQQNSVLIQHLVVDGTLDATFVQKLVAKQEVITAAMDAGVQEDKEALAAELFEVTDVVVVATTTEAEAEAAANAAEEEHQRQLAERQAEIERLKAERQAVSAERQAEWDRQIAEREAAARAEEERRHAETLKLLDGVGQDAVEAAYAAMGVIAAVDGDYAFEENDMGFSKAFTGRGHRLAEMPLEARSRLDDAFAIKLARIFRRQVPADLRARIEARL